MAESRSPGADSPDPYRELFERSADAILIIEGDMFVDCNGAAVRMLRYASKEEVLRTHPSELSPPTQPDGRDSYEKANEMIALAFEKGNHRFEWAHRRADGEVFPVEVLLTAVREEERETLHVVWRDITERRHLEEQLRHAQKMEAVGKLAGGIAHDFNNLLVVILGHADMLREHAGGQPEAMDHVDQITEAGQRAAGLVKQLLAFGRKQQLLPEVLDVNDLVDGMRRLLERLIGEDLTLETTPAAGSLCVEADRGQLEQVLMNLASNARDAMPHGGVLRIGVGREDVAPDADAGNGDMEPGAYAVITVSDTGVGMSPEIAARAFDPFFTTKAPGEGTGLGLATVYGIVRQSGGGVRLESAPGEGTTVRVYLPLSAETGRSEGPRLPARPVTSGGGESILVVEDEEAVARLVVRALSALGYAVESAADGAEGYEAFMRDPERFDMVVSDVIMPRASGPEMVARLEAAGYRPGVLFLSGYTNDALSARHELGEGVDLLTKPFSTQELARRVREVLDARADSGGGPARRAGP